MAATAVQSEILQLEKRYWDAIKSQDIDAMEALTADPCLVVGPQGASLVDRKQFREIWSNDDWRVRSFKIDDASASTREVGNNTVALAYKVNEELEHLGKPQKMEAYDTSVWVRENGSWRCAVHTETPSLSMMPS
jgi:ketosteroid isomerase-like protein